MSDDLIRRANHAFGDTQGRVDAGKLALFADCIDRIEELEAKLAKAVEALDEAVYLLAPDEKDMMRQAGVYRVVTTLAELKGQNDE